MRGILFSGEPVKFVFILSSLFANPVLIVKIPQLQLFSSPLVDLPGEETAFMQQKSITIFDIFAEMFHIFLFRPKPPFFVLISHKPSGLLCAHS